MEELRFTAADAQPEADKKKKRILQLVLSPIVFAGYTVLLFVPDTPLGSSLFEQLLACFRGESAYGGAFDAAVYTNLAVYATVLACTAVSAFLQNDRAVYLNLLKTAAALAGTLFYLCVLTAACGLSFTEIFRSANATFLALVFGIAALLVFLFMLHKTGGILKFVLLLTAAGFLAVFPQAFIGAYDFGGILAGAALGSDTLAAVTAAVFRIFACVLLLDLLAALFALPFRRTTVFDLVRAAAVLAVSAVAFILLGVYDKFANGLAGLGTIVTTGIALIQFLLALSVFLVLRAKKKKAAAEEENSLFVVGKDNQMALRGWEQPAAAETAFGEEAERTNNAFEAAAQLTFDDLEAGSAAKAAYDSAIRGEQAADKPKDLFDFEQARYDGNFNRTFADFEEKARTENAPTYEEFRTAAPAEPPRTYDAAGSGYVPDAFINGLSDAERDEFNKLFISRIYGENKRLPAYTVGGDNREFFAKVFVFMGRYRNVISDGLLEKIYEYSNLIR